MSCWVVPTIAAELWGVGVDQILQLARDGDMAYRVDEGFMFVDVAPNGGGCGRPVEKQEHPPTFTVLSENELEALQPEEPAGVVPAESADARDDASDDEEPETQSPDDDEASADLGDWRAARQRVGRTRIPPKRLSPIAA